MLAYDELNFVFDLLFIDSENKSERTGATSKGIEMRMTKSAVSNRIVVLSDQLVFYNSGPRVDQDLLPGWTKLYELFMKYM